MNNEINEFIYQQFDLKEGCSVENVEKLESELKQVNELQSRINTILSQQKEDIFKKWTSALREDFPLLNVQEGKEGELTKTGVLIENGSDPFSILIEKLTHRFILVLESILLDKTSLMKMLFRL
ncbi:hypothetical protein [Providencia sp. PROV102]|uniref:hypothetical protein n=1 Tax=Providencia sp. PROV102 TaxID=2936787 RepID=UPI00298F7737|nr:hypothetical protein [Providencia sp. PROV102]